jgi:hypothetical protein
MVWALSVLLPMLASNLVDPALGVPASAVDNEVNNQTSKMELAAHFELATYGGPSAINYRIDSTQNSLREKSGKLITMTSGNTTLYASVTFEEFEKLTEVVIRCQVDVPERPWSKKPIALTMFGYAFNEDFKGRVFTEDRFPFYKLKVNLYPVDQ